MKLIFDSQNRLLIEIHDIIKYNVPPIHYYTVLTNRYVDIRIMINQLVKTTFTCLDLASVKTIVCPKNGIKIEVGENGRNLTYDIFYNRFQNMNKN